MEKTNNQHLRRKITKKMRFEIFKRDKFTCQYCGNKAPEVVLELEHIIPLSGGGTNDEFNLTTSCLECNRGKGDRKLSDRTALEKQRNKMEVVQERREQMKMMMQWRDELANEEDEKIKYFKKEFNRFFPTSELTDKGIVDLRKWLKKYDLDALLDAIEKSYQSYSPDVSKTFNMIPRIIESIKKQGENPDYYKLYYIRGILRNRLQYIDDEGSVEYMKQALSKGVSVESIQKIATVINDWEEFLDLLKNEIRLKEQPQKVSIDFSLLEEELEISFRKSPIGVRASKESKELFMELIRLENLFEDLTEEQKIANSEEINKVIVSFLGALGINNQLAYFFNETEQDFYREKFADAIGYLPYVASYKPVEECYGKAIEKCSKMLLVLLKFEGLISEV